MRTAMKDFNNIQDLWNHQKGSASNTTASDIIAKSEAHKKNINRNHLFTIVIISMIAAMLVGYLLWVGFFEWHLFTIGLILMILTLLIRIIIEMVSSNKFRKLNPKLSLSDYSQGMLRFYQWRKTIHLKITPIIYISYIIGFTMILPTLKANLSIGFYWYCLVSGFGFLIGFGFFMFKKIKEELRQIAFLKSL